MQMGVTDEVAGLRDPVAGDQDMRWGRLGPILFVVAPAALLIAPIWAVALPALPDLPAHLACFFLLSGGIADAPLSHFYRIDWQFVPNLASEATVPFLVHIVGLVAATKIFLSLAVAVWVLGAAAIQRALFGRTGAATLLASFFAYNVNFFWGFMNYEFGAGLALVVFAAWIVSANWARATRLAVFAAVTLVIYFCHIFAAAMLLFMIACFELDRLVRVRSLFSRASGLTLFDLSCIAAPTVAAFLFLKPNGADGSHLEFNLLSTWLDRLGAAFQMRFDDPGYVVLVLLSLFWIVGVWRGWLRVHPSMRIVLIGLLVLSIFLPEWALGGWGVDLRVPALLGATVFAASEIVLSMRWQRGLAIAATVLLSLSAAAAGGNWAYYDRQYAEFRAALKDVPEGAKIVTALDGDAMGLASDEPYWHMAEFAVMDRHGFTPLLFTTAGQHVVRVQPQYQPFVAATAQQGSPPDVGELPDLAAGQANGDEDIPVEYPYLMFFQCHYDLMVVIRSSGKPSPVTDLLRLRHRGSFFDLYDVRRDRACARS